MTSFLESWKFPIKKKRVPFAMGDFPFRSDFGLRGYLVSEIPFWPGRCLWSMFVMDTRSSGTTAQAKNGDGKFGWEGEKTSVGTHHEHVIQHPWRKFQPKISFCKTLFLVLAANCKLQVKKRGTCPNESFLESLVPQECVMDTGGIAPFDDKHSGQAGESLVIFFNVKKDS